MNTDLGPTIISLPIFSALTLAEADDLASCCEVRRVGDGETLFTEGEPSQHLYVILSGGLRLSCMGPGGVQVVVGTATKGDIVGEMGVLDDAVRSATATAPGGTVVLQLAGSGFSRMVDGGHPAAWWMMRRIRMDLCGRLRQVDERVDAVFDDGFEGGSGDIPGGAPDDDGSTDAGRSAAGAGASVTGRLRSFILSIKGLT